MRNDNRTILRGCSERPVTLNHEIDCQTQLTQPVTCGCGCGILRAGDGLGIIGHDGDIVAAAHELLELAGAPAGICVEDLHHVLFSVAQHVCGRFLPVGWHVVRLVAVQHLQDVVSGGSGDDGRGDDLIHGLVVTRVRRIVHQASACCIDVCEAQLFSYVSTGSDSERERGSGVLVAFGLGQRVIEKGLSKKRELTSRKECHSDSLLMSDALQCPDQVRALEVLGIMRPHVL